MAPPPLTKMASPGAATTRSVARMRRVSFSKYVNWRYLSTCNRLLAMPVIAPEELYLEKANYPKIRDTSKDATTRYKRLDRYEEIKRMRTVAEKMLAVSTLERQRCFVFRGCLNRYGAMDFVQHITKTHFIRGLPQTDGTVDATPLVDLIRQPILDAVSCENAKIQWTLPTWKNQDVAEDPVPERSILNVTVNHLMSALAPHFNHLLSGQVMEQPRCDAFWWRGNDHTDLNKALHLRNSLYQVPTFQLDWRPDFLIRMPGPLPTLVDRDSPLCASNDVPYCPYHPKNFNMKLEPKRFLTCTPGFWPGDECQFPYLSLVSSSPLLQQWRLFYGQEDVGEALDQAAILCSFGWLLASAAIQGFMPYHELTYPLVARSIYTDGKTWTFYVYQMNTLAVHPDVDEKTHRNVCWTSGAVDLYETIEDGQAKGVNEGVLKTLVEFFTQRPHTSRNLDLNPYLDGPEKEEALGLMKSNFDNRPDAHAHKTEVPTWHRVYKLNPKAPLSPRVKLH